MSVQRPRRAEARSAHPRVGQVLAVSVGGLLLFAAVGIVLALLANGRLSDQRRTLLDQIQPASIAALELENALVNQETGVRGYLLTAEPRFLDPYRSGLQAESQAYAALAAASRERAGAAAISSEVDVVRVRAQAWQHGFVERALLHARRGAAGSVAPSAQGKTLFDSVRRALARLQGDLAHRESAAGARLSHEASVLQLALILAGALILGSVAGSGYLLRRMITRPLERLGAEARRVGSGTFGSPLVLAGGPREILQLGDEIEAMRARIVHELAAVDAARTQLERQALELSRSNAELEQFAYVASHDLQEPLRKVASFCQALEHRYGGQLDERADEYIAFAVDGAKRMQILINDLLAFSRVGRSGREPAPVDLAEVASAAEASLSTALREAGARVEVADLPVIDGERALLVSVFQNLIANAVKFRGSDPPVVRIGCTRGDGEWRLSCEDNGIGVDPEYAERIFVIFQRLHTRERYEGTGIGLAMCRKIVEYHGGRISLDPTFHQGARFCFTLPIAKETTT